MKLIEPNKLQVSPSVTHSVRFEFSINVKGSWLPWGQFCLWKSLKKESFALSCVSKQEILVI